MTDWTEPAIPGETPIDRIGLRIASITTRRELNAYEAEGIRKVALKYFATKPNQRLASFEMGWLLKLHREMFGSVWDWAGKIRSKELNLGYPIGAIAEGLASLIGDLHSWSGYGVPLIEQSARLHHRAVKIHPFNNGNGRWSRMLANIWLRRNDEQPIMWPEDM